MCRSWIGSGSKQLSFMFRGLARYALRKLHLYGLYSLAIKGPLHDDGWFVSFEEECPLDAQGRPLPFITYPAIEFLQRRVHSSMSVFEYGAGMSTLWWASRVKEVVACEHDPEWYRKVSEKAPPNVSVIYVPLVYDGAYCKTILQYTDRFDFAVIDGRDRVRCAMNALPALKTGGVIVWDNSDRREYADGYEFLRSHGFRSIEFIGLAPGINEKTMTSVFYRPVNCLGI